MKGEDYMKKLILASITLLFLAASVAEAAGNPRMGLTRWQNKAGWGSVDSLTWSNQAGNSRKDTIGVTIKDTTTNEVDISGVTYVSFWVNTSQWARAVTSPLSACAKFTFQVSPDLNNWISLATTYSQTGAATDTEMVVIYNKDAAGDSVLSAIQSVSSRSVTGADMRKVRAAKYLRVLMTTGNLTGDSLMVKSTMVVREWPLDIK